LDITDNIFRVTFWNTPRFPVLRRLLSTKKTMSNTEYCKILGLSRHQAYRELKRLVTDGCLKLAGGGRGVNYNAGGRLFPES